MTRTEIIRSLRPHRRSLVDAAENALKTAYARGGDALPPSKTQFSRLVNLCNEASCAEELENYLRYQAGRRGSSRESWRMPFVDILLAELQPVSTRLIELSGSDAALCDLLRVEAWRLYATYLARAFTYEDAKRRSHDRPGQFPDPQNRAQNNPRRDRGHHDQRNSHDHG